MVQQHSCKENKRLSTQQQPKSQSNSMGHECRPMGGQQSHRPQSESEAKLQELLEVYLMASYL